MTRLLIMDVAVSKSLKTDDAVNTMSPHSLMLSFDLRESDEKSFVLEFEK